MTFAENINRICAEKGTNLTAIVKAVKGSSSFATAINTKGSLPKESEMLEMKKPLLTKERIMYWLESFKRGDIEDVEYQRRIIDTLVNSVYVYDDGDKGRKLALTFNISVNNTLTISSSDIERTAPPNSANPNSFFFVKHCVGFVFIVEDVG